MRKRLCELYPTETDGFIGLAPFNFCKVYGLLIDKIDNDLPSNYYLE